ncbi:hypothetical protein ACR777_05410 [Sphingobacterium spiritivorum]|uniref:hypothetical protein n=1 Tax=Sphingobacterium spiritivorum TaxID=258 RepID=UPI003DA1ED59
MKTTLYNLTAILFNAIIGIGVAMICGFNPYLGAAIVNLLAVLFALYKFYYSGTPLFSRGSLFVGLLHEVWLSKLMEKFYPNGAWLTEGQNMTEFVEANKIHLGDCGVDPEVLINNTTYPIEVSERVDAHLEIVLDNFDTKNTVVRNAEQVQLKYNKLESVVRGHRMALFTANIRKAAHAYGPQSNAINTPIITLGAGSIIEAVIDAQNALDDINAPEEGRILLLCPAHQAKLRKEDNKLYKEIFGQKGANELYGFKVFKTTVTPTYASDGTKKVFDSAPAAGDKKSSLFYLASEVMYADGEYDMFSRLKDPEARGDIVGFQKRFVAVPIRNKYNGAIID